MITRIIKRLSRLLCYKCNSARNIAFYDLDRIHKCDLVEEVFDYNGQHEILLKNKKRLYLRKSPSSDLKVFEQIFIYKEYASVIGLLLNAYQSKKIIMIDAGANIGLVSCYFSMFLDIKCLISVEPFIANFDLLNRNVDSFLQNTKVINYNKAISHSSYTRFEISNEFRDGMEWSKVFVESQDGSVFGVTLNDLIIGLDNDCIKFLKLDIEGAERFVFSSYANRDFLNYIHIISIEIHDEYDIRSTIYKELKNYGFVTFDSGELTIGFKPEYIIGANC